MILGNAFDGDSEQLQKMQEGVYWDFKIAGSYSTGSVGYIAYLAQKLNREKHLISGLPNDNVSSLDHRTLQTCVHDIIAAQYRFLSVVKQDPNCDENPWRWRDFITDELHRFAKNCPEIIITICMVLNFQNMDNGYNAEDRLAYLLLEQYKEMRSKSKLYTDMYASIYAKYKQ